MASITLYRCDHCKRQIEGEPVRHPRIDVPRQVCGHDVQPDEQDRNRHATMTASVAYYTACPGSPRDLCTACFCRIATDVVEELLAEIASRLDAARPLTEVQ